MLFNYNNILIFLVVDSGSGQSKNFDSTWFYVDIKR